MSGSVCSCCLRIMCWGEFERGEESDKTPETRRRRRRRRTVLHQHSSKKKKSSSDNITTTIISTSSRGIQTDSVDNTTKGHSSNCGGVRAFLFLILLLQLGRPQPGHNVFLLLLTGILFPKLVLWAAAISIFTTSPWWTVRFTQLSVACSWLLPFSAYYFEIKPNKALMSSIGYLEYLLQQGYVWAIPASSSRLGGREEFRGGGEKMKLGFEDLEADLWSRLPEEILEKILARLPLKNVMQMCLLSKTYLQKLSSPGFQAEVCRNSVNFRSLCPLHLSHSSLKVQGYDPSVNKWQDLMSLSYLPEQIRKDCVLSKFHPIAHNDTNRSFQSMAGSLLCFMQADSGPSSDLIIHVTNPLNRTLRKLPHIVSLRPQKLYSVKILPVGFHDYRVIMLELDTMRLERVNSGSEGYPVRVHIYDSATFSWCSKREFTSLPSRWRCSSIEYHQGRLYFLYNQQSHFEGQEEEEEEEGQHDSSGGSRVSENVLSLGVYDLESEVWKPVALPVRYPYKFSNSSLCVCGSRLFMVVVEEFLLPCIEFEERTMSMGSSIRKNSIRIFELDPDALQFREVSRGPPEDIEKEYLSGKFYHDEDTIFFSALRNTTVAAYNVCRQSWVTQPSLGDERSRFNGYYGFLQHAYQPGLNPFRSAGIRDAFASGSHSDYHVVKEAEEGT
ncbi:hypothetical protein R1sor_023598 [Riccia sorocarpa]|uniref:F-box domain-containing protein n=1 Tax=Riccia sorocarpa TaxID=122646 RepID=A0ABD3GN48_9MARC